MNKADCTDEKDACGVGFVYRPLNSHQVISDALTALSRMEHRGACGADGVTGDGAGILTAIPWTLFSSEGWSRSQGTAVGMIFLPQGAEEYCRHETERLLVAEGFQVEGWRQVPLDKSALGPLALRSCPAIEQVFVEAPLIWTEQLMEQKLLFARKRIINFLWSQGDLYADFYICSLSRHTIVYKGMVRSRELPLFFTDLSSPLYTSPFAGYHRRFSTNTMPRWRLAQRVRMLGHHGEINTLFGNRNWMKCREMILDHPDWDKQEGLLPVVSATTSDSGSLDNVVELLVSMGRSPEAALMQLIPDPVWHGNRSGEQKQIDGFFDYFAGIQEPWDGPALIVYSDGATVGAKLDRNGMRPARFARLKDGSLFLSSEAGVVDFDPGAVAQMGRLGPGQILSIDIESGRVSSDLDVKLTVSTSHPYRHWVDDQRIQFAPQAHPDQIKMGEAELIALQMAHGYGKEDIVQILKAMASTGHEAVYSMGDDTPLAVLSNQSRLLYDYFKQRFAQVTNPPIDHIRENLVMSMDVYLGRQTGWFTPAAHGARAIHHTSPILNENELQSLADQGEKLCLLSNCLCSFLQLNAHWTAPSHRCADRLKRRPGRGPA